MARSGLPSPLKSATTTDQGLVPVAKGLPDAAVNTCALAPVDTASKKRTLRRIRLLRCGVIKGSFLLVRPGCHYPCTPWVSLQGYARSNWLATRIDCQTRLN